MTKETDNPTFYDADSAKYDEQRWVSPAGERTNRVQQDIVEQLCADWTGGTVLEVGPGTARFTVPLAKRGNRMTLLDISAGMLAQARQKIEGAGLIEQIDDFVEGSIYELPFDDGAFDHAICLNVFNHLERAGDALAELARVIKPGSTLLFNYANLRSFYWAAGHRINSKAKAVGQDVYSRWERPADVRRMIAAAGLELDETRGHAHAPRAVERLHLLPVVAMLDRVSRRGPLRPLAPIHYCRCRRTA